MAIIRKSAEVNWARYHIDPSADKNQIMFPNPAKSDDHTASFNEFFIFKETKKTHTTINAPIKCATICCGKSSPKIATKGMAITAGIGGLAT